MICTKCAEAADGVDFGPVRVCSVCGQGPIAVYNDAKPLDRQSAVRHKAPDPQDPNSGYQVWCPGSKLPPQYQSGHDFCKGCDCQHKPPGSHRG